MKHLKSKLISAIAMLAVAAVMMTSATYAWMTISTNPEISDIKANVVANGNFEIALDAGSMTKPGASTTSDAGKNETWGNLVDLKGAFQTSSGGIATLQLKPVGIISSAITVLDSSGIANSSGVVVFQYPEYGKDGRISKLTNLNRVRATDGAADNFKDLGGVYFYTTSSAVKSSGISDISSNEVYAVEIDYWLRTNAENSSAITLVAPSSGISSSSTPDSGVSRSEDAADTYAGENGLGSFISIDTVTILLADTTDKKVYEAVPSAIASSSFYSLALKEVEWKESTKTYEVKSGGIEYIKLDKDEAKLIRMYIFMDGAVLENSDAKLTMTEFTMNVQFTSNKELTAMDVPMTDYDRASAISSSAAW